MANPYHDETGKFCSRDGMLKAIDRLAISGDTEGYLKLRTEMNQIEADVIHVKQEDIASLFEKKVFATTEDEVAKIKNPELLAILVDKLVRDKEKAPDYYAYNARLAEAYLHPSATIKIKNTIEDVIDGELASCIIASDEASDSLKEQLFREHSKTVPVNDIREYLASGKIPAAEVAEALEHQSAYSTLGEIATPEMWDTPAAQKMFNTAISYPIPSANSFGTLHYHKPTGQFLRDALRTLPDEGRRAEAIEKLEKAGYNQEKILYSLVDNPDTTEYEVKTRLVKNITSGEPISLPDSSRFQSFTAAARIAAGMKENNETLIHQAQKYSGHAVSTLTLMGNPKVKDIENKYKKLIKDKSIPREELTKVRDEFVRVTALTKLASLHTNPDKRILSNVEKGSLVHNDMVTVLEALIAREKMF